MKKLFSVLLALFVAQFGRAATGDISVTVNPDGWSANLTTAGFTSGATYAFGTSTNNTPGASTPYFTVVSLGYDNTGTATTVTRQVYLTKVVRFPYSTISIPGTYTSGTFVDGETITEAVTGATAIVVGNQSSGALLIAYGVTGSPATAHAWTGGTSGAVFAQVGTTSTLTLPTNNEEVSSTGMTVRVALSDYIFQKDNSGGGNSGTAPTVTIPAAFITNTGGASQTSNVLTAAAVTQSSTAAYQKVVGNWSWPGYQRVTADFTLRAVAFHGTSAVNGGVQVSPGTLNIACVKFTAADTHSHTTTTITTAPTYDSTMLDAAPVVEFIGTMSVSPLTALDVLTCNFIAYPVVGDSGSILDTSAGTAAPTPLYGPITNLNDKSNTYGVTVALVDPTGSDGGANTVYDIASYPGDASAYKFLTVAKAAATIAAYNNSNHSRNDCGGGIIYCNTGTYNWCGSSNTYGNIPATWVTVTHSASSSTAGVQFSAQNGGSNIGRINKMLGVSITGNSHIFIDTDSFWIDQGIISTTGGEIFGDTIKALYVTRTALAGFLQGIKPYSNSYNMAPAIVRGNNLDGFLRTIFYYTCLGNAGAPAASQTSTMFVNSLSGQGAPTNVNTIFAFNKVTKFLVDEIAFSSSDDFVNTHGFAVVQNLIENTIAGIGTEVIATAETSVMTPVNNGIFWNNTFLGGKWNLAYNDSGSTSMVRKFWSIKNNNADDTNIKADTFTGGPANGVRQGNWPAVYGVSFSGNMFPEITGVGAAGAFVFEFPGLKTFQPSPISGQPPSDTPSVAGYIGYTNLLAYNGTTTPTAGGGTYTLTSSAPGKALQREFLVPVDLGGLSRTAIDAAGAYHYGTAPNDTLFFRRR